MKDDNLYLIHIIECIARIEEYTINGKSEFLSSSLIQDAVIRNLQIMTESTQKLSENLKQTYPDVGWRQLSGFRNVLAHDYLGLNLERVWEVIESDLPTFRISMNDIITDLKSK